LELCDKARHDLSTDDSSSTAGAAKGTYTSSASDDNGRRLTHWQNAPSSPTSTADFACDGEGNRVAQKTTVSGTTTTTDYIAGVEEQTGGTLTKYYGISGLPTAVDVGGTISWLATDGLSSVAEAISTTGTVTAQQLFAPYGGVRYSNGTMPTAKGFTGQYQDATSGLDYYNARYYDAVLGQFVSADSDAGGGLNRYGYVMGNPETAPDLTAHRCADGTCGVSQSPPPCALFETLSDNLSQMNASDLNRLG
jgi:RHS repeat-associated protein